LFQKSLIIDLLFTRNYIKFKLRTSEFSFIQGNSKQTDHL